MVQLKAVLEKVFFEVLKSFQPKQTILDLFCEIIIDIWGNREKDKINDRKRIEAELQNLKNKKAKLLNLMLDEFITHKIYTKRN